jgi:hypothetical protein
LVVATAEVAQGSAAIHTTTEGGGLLAPASVIDSGTGDLVFVPAR